jgi:hypothetical protein
MVALALSHGKNVDWEKVSSSHAQHPEEMKEFFSEAKKYASNVLDSSRANAFTCYAFV